MKCRIYADLGREISHHSSEISDSSVICRFDPPCLFLHHKQISASGGGKDLELGPPAGRRRVPPALVGRPRTCPRGDLCPMTAVDEEASRAGGHDMPASHAHE